MNPSTTGPRLRGRSWALIALGTLLLATIVLVRVEITGPRIHVRWSEQVAPSERMSLEQRYGLHAGTLLDPATNTWRYELGNRSTGNLRTLLDDGAVVDVAYVDRETLTTEGRTVSLALRYPYDQILQRPSDLWRLHRSLWLLLASGALLWGAHATDLRRRRRVAVVTLVAAGTLMTTLPFHPSMVVMGGSSDHTRSRRDFEEWFGGRVRFEKHLSQMTLLQIYERLEPTEEAPDRALLAVTRIGTAWFVLSALALAAAQSWSPVVLRYLGLALLAPSALLYFGWRELGYLSLNVAAFPLLVRGLRDGTGRLDASSVLAGLGTALHGTGAVALASTWLATLGAAGRLVERYDRLLRVIVWGTAAWVGWIALYVIVLKLPVSPDAGLAQFTPWRPLFVEDERLGRIAMPLLSATTARDLAMSAWLIGAPLLLVALSAWRRYPYEVRTALWYLGPSVLFVLFRWPFDGIGRGIDLVVGGFPAFYALAWACAQDVKRTIAAALLLLPGHYLFWWAVLDDLFVP